VVVAEKDAPWLSDAAAAAAERRPPPPSDSDSAAVLACGAEAERPPLFVAFVGARAGLPSVVAVAFDDSQEQLFLPPLGLAMVAPFVVAASVVVVFVVLVLGLRRPWLATEPAWPHVRSRVS